MKKTLLLITTYILSTSTILGQTHIGDVTIDGSLGVGFDMTATPNFGFSTILMQENNLRIRFDDTSDPAGGFPSNDWDLEANSSSNGGTDHFAIVDVTGAKTPFLIEADARTNALYIESDGDIGVGTDSPVVDLHIQSGNTPTIRLDQDGTSGWTPQAWDLASNETNFFIRDVTNGSLLPLRIRPNTPTNALDMSETVISVNGNGLDLDFRVESDLNENQLYIDASAAMVGIGTNEPTAILDINGENFRLRGIANTGSNGDDDGVPDIGKVLVSTDILGTAQWEINPLQEEFDLLTARVEALEIAVTNCCGTFVNEVDGVLEAQLFQNYPNPFDQSTIIEYYLPHDVNSAFLEIYSTSGQLVSKLNINSTGKGHVLIGANSLAPGNYLYTLMANEILVGTKQMVITD